MSVEVDLRSFLPPRRCLPNPMIDKYCFGVLNFTRNEQLLADGNR
jgi:hypothetical protein